MVRIKKTSAVVILQYILSNVITVEKKIHIAFAKQNINLDEF
jgi:hypothetical protein